MQPKTQINVRSFSKVVLTVGCDSGGPVETANWTVRSMEPRVIKSGSRAIKVEDGMRVSLNRANKLLRGRTELSAVTTRPSEELETA